MTYAFELSDRIPASPLAIYEAWMSSEGHSAMTGGDAHVDGEVGGSFDAWDGYISGVNVTMDPGRRIVQTWRTTKFTEGQADSHIEVSLAAVEGGTLLTLVHANVPDDHRSYEESGWQSHYFDPMKEYFGRVD